MATALRNMRIPDEEWRALGEYAKAKRLDRTAVVREWIRAYVPDDFWPKADEIPGQGLLLGL